jgi:hypothetical protein
MNIQEYHYDIEGVAHGGQEILPIMPEEISHFPCEALHTGFPGKRRTLDWKESGLSTRGPTTQDI